MATYKLIQDIEAEDKILGPLTLRQFIFALVAVFLFYLCFMVVIKHVIFLLAIFLPPALFCGFFALPFGRDQPTEIWALAKLRFWFKPRRRIWNQSGVKELVTITVPKKIEHAYTNGLSQTEVKSRLQALAQTIDSRGWAIKHVTAEAYAGQPAVVGDSDRLIDISNLPEEVPADDMAASTDILDAASNPIARQFDTMIDESSRARRQGLINQLKSAAPSQASGPATASSSTWFTGRTQPTATVSSPAVVTATPVPTAIVDPATEASMSATLVDRANSGHVSFGNLRTMQPLSAPKAAPVTVSDDPVGGVASADGQSGFTEPNDTMTTPRDPAILSLANNNDLNLATIAREANKTRGNENQSQNEVIVALH